jgi:hypothetical protein
MFLCTRKDTVYGRDVPVYQERSCVREKWSCLPGKILCTGEMFPCTRKDPVYRRDVPVYRERFCVGERCSCLLGKILCTGEMFLCAMKDPVYKRDAPVYEDDPVFIGGSIVHRREMGFNDSPKHFWY